MTSTRAADSRRRWFHPVSIGRSFYLNGRLLIAGGAGIAALLSLPDTLRPALRSSLAWDIGGLCYLAITAVRVLGTKGTTSQLRAARTDESALVILVLVLIAILASFAAIAGLSGEAKEAPKAERLIYLLVAGGTLFISWFVTQVVFTGHYARLYCTHERENKEGVKPLQFPGGGEPDYWDFLYFSTSIGASSQTSDTGITCKTIRRLVTLHAVVSFLFNTMVLAITINLAAGLL